MMLLVRLFANEYRELLALAPAAEQYARQDARGWVLDLPPDVRARLADVVAHAVAQTERTWLALGRQIWLDRPPRISNEEYARREAAHGDAERRHRVLSRVLAALLETAADS